MPPVVNRVRLGEHLRTARSLADLQQHTTVGPTFSTQSVIPDPGQASSRISPEDLQVFREKFPHLNDFSTAFLQSRTLEELLRIESTSLRIKDAERARDIEEKLANNKTALSTKFFEVNAGKDNRWNVLHPARFLPSVACSAQKQFTTAREVIGLTSPPQLACYDMTAVGMGGFVTNRGWYEISTMGSSKMKVSMFNINNATKSSSFKSSDAEDAPEMKDVSEFEVALRAMRIAAHFVQPWNFAFVALENFLLQNQFCKEDLKYDTRPARTLCQFVDFILNENSNHWRDGSTFISTGELESYWRSFIGARPQIRYPPGTSTASKGKEQHQQGQQAQKQQKDRKRKFPFVDICHRWNTNNCSKAAGACFNARGTPLRHCCDWRDPANPSSQPCGQAHTRVGNH
jgi:hypothetical protein